MMDIQNEGDALYALVEIYRQLEKIEKWTFTLRRRHRRKLTRYTSACMDSIMVLTDEIVEQFKINIDRLIGKIEGYEEAKEQVDLPISKPLHTGTGE